MGAPGAGLEVVETWGGYGDLGRYGPSTPMKRLRRVEDDITSYIATYDLVAFMDKNW